MRIDEREAPHPATVVTTTAMSATRAERAKRLFNTATIGHHVHAAWNVKLEVFIGQPPVFLQVTEGEGGSAALRIDGRQELNLKGFRVHANAQRFIFVA